MKINKYNNKLNISGDYIRKAREKQNISQEMLANKLTLLGITLYGNDIYRIETNQRTIRDYELIAICIILNIDINIFKKIIE